MPTHLLLICSKLNDQINIPIAHGEGRYITSDDKLHDLNENNQIVFKYKIKTQMVLLK